MYTLNAGVTITPCFVYTVCVKRMLKAVLVKYLKHLRSPLWVVQQVSGSRSSPMQGFAVRYVAKVGHQNIKYVLYKYSDM